MVWLTVVSFAFAKGPVLAHSKPPRLPKTHSDIGRMKGGEYTLDDKSLIFELCKVVCICSKVQSGRGDRVSLAKCSMQALRQLRQQTNCLALALPYAHSIFALRRYPQWMHLSVYTILVYLYVRRIGWTCDSRFEISQSRARVHGVRVVWQPKVVVQTAPRY